MSYRQGRDYTRESIERALDVHVAAGRIRSWRPVDPNTAEALTGTGYLYIVELWQHDPLVLRSLREAFVFVCGLASAGCAPSVTVDDAPQADPCRVGPSAATDDTHDGTPTRQGPAGSAS